LGVQLGSAGLFVERALHEVPHRLFQLSLQLVFCVVVGEWFEMEVVLADGFAFGFGAADVEAIDDLLHFFALLLLVRQLRVELLDLRQHLEQALLHLPLSSGVFGQLLLVVVAFQLQLLYLQLALLQPRRHPQRLPLPAPQLHSLAQLLRIAESWLLRLLWRFGEFLQVAVQVVEEALLFECGYHRCAAVARPTASVEGSCAIFGRGDLL